MTPKDELIVSFGDFHSGSLVALFPDYEMLFEYDKNNVIPYRPSVYQSSMYKHFVSCAKQVKELGKGKRKRLVMNGDAIDGNHHGTWQLISPNVKHHSQIHVELMENFLADSGFSIKNGDELHYVSGTETHVGWEEYGVKKKLEAYGAQYHDELKMAVNGKRLWWVHEGPKPGKGANEGNAVRNFARDTYWDCVKEKIAPPHLISTSHYHKNTYESYNQSYEHTVHIQVLPSWQMKTRYGLSKSPFQRNDIGMVLNVVTAEGDIRIMKPLLWDGNPQQQGKE